jgi:transmembrane sensor
MKPHEFKALLDKFSRGECNSEEIQLVNEWFDNIGEEQQSSISDSESSTLEEALWSKINPSPVAVSRSISFYALRVAAAILLLAIVGLGIYKASFKISTPHQNAAVQSQEINNDNAAAFARVVNHKRKPQQVILEDGTRVTLQPESEVRFAKNFITDKREIFLTGEAFFNVKRDETRPFLVYTKEVVTKVLGTSFSIKAYPNEKEITVAVKTGKVSVYANSLKPAAAKPTTKEVILTPNQQVVYNRIDERVSKQLVKHPEVILSKSTLFTMHYDGSPVTKIFQVLEENYGVEINYDEELLKNCVLTTTMSDEGLYERIEVICKAIGAHYTVEDAVIFVKSNGCK